MLVERIILPTLGGGGDGGRVTDVLLQFICIRNRLGTGSRVARALAQTREAIKVFFFSIPALRARTHTHPDRDTANNRFEYEFMLEPLSLSQRQSQ